MNVLSVGAKGHLTILNDASNGPLTVEVEEIRGVQMYLLLPSQLPFACAVRFETSDTVLLGDVTHCEPRESGFVAGVTVRHKLSLLPMLDCIGENLPTEPDRRPLLRPEPEGAAALRDLVRLNSALLQAESHQNIPEDKQARAGKM